MDLRRLLRQLHEDERGAWTAPRTWAAETLTSALLNTHLRDNLNALSLHTHTGAAGDGEQMGWLHIDTQVLSGTAASVSFASIAADYVQFRLTFYIENDANAKQYYLRFNNDATGTYDYTGAAAQTQMLLNIVGNIAASESAFGTLHISKPAAGLEALVWGESVILTTATTPSVEHTSGTWQNVAALISRIDIIANANNFASGTRMVLEGNRSS